MRNKKKKAHDKRKQPVVKKGVLGSKTVLFSPRIRSMEDLEKQERKIKNKIVRNRNLKTSQGELQIIRYLKSKEIPFQREHEFKDCINPFTRGQYRFDFYLPDHNTCIEFDGIQHYAPSKPLHGNKAKKKFEEQKFNDRQKTEYCLSKNIRLIRIPYWKIREVWDVLDNELTPK